MDRRRCSLSNTMASNGDVVATSGAFRGDASVGKQSCEVNVKEKEE